jgi:alpha-beta hydrolase superfamily lysophospholipase
MALREIQFQSFNERDTIKAWIHTPIGKPKGIIQIVHGFGEHSRRYLHMALKMNEAGFVVCFDDHVGHGKTAYDSNTFGDFGVKGYMTTTEDENKLRKIVQEEFTEIPYFMFGHSWGSMIARNYAANYGAGMAGLGICGTPGHMTYLDEVGGELKALVAAGKGNEIDPSFLMRIFAGTTDRITNPITPNDWISAYPDVVADHAADPFNNLLNPPNIQSLCDLTDIIAAITGTQWAQRVPKDLPIYNIAGDQDPIGNYGEGVYAVSNWLGETGHKKLTTKLYSGHRHEIHNDPDIRDEVEDGIIAFFESLV